MAEYSGGISISQTRDCHSYTSGEEEDDDQSPTRTGALFLVGDGSSSGVTPPTKRNSSSSNKTVAGSGTGRDFGSTGEIVRKPRGRPPGSKNKPKPPIVITRDSDAAMRPVVLEISAGTDVVQMVSQYARRRHVGLCVVSGSGTVTNVTLRLPVSHSSTLMLQGTYHILSLSATFLDSSASKSSSSMIASPPITISLAGAQGQVFGGTIAGSLTAASNVVLVAATFVNPSFHRLPLVEEDDETENEKPTGLVVVTGGGGVGSGSAIDACTTKNPGMSMNVYRVQSPSPLNCQISPDHVLSWPSTSRPSHY
ncbi:AT-hook motif nuclear-localized protein 28-like [Telopea speciosissima]|uniref:AT-hook motif nuclear-localized protein 28-like n=1 Tax=Telopea speciosissima TaxID=54955 RepID=UPI001CC55AB1|nr:AT-hook motif nuclear-localized protein 28-like [Telopea speciosissima]